MLANLKITTKLSLLIGAFALGFFAFAFVALRTLDEVQVNGPVYRDIVQGKDLIADVLPPPEYIIESYLVAMQLGEERDRSAQDQLVRRGKALREEYEVRHKVWKQDLVAGATKQAMTVSAYRPAVDFFEIRDREFVPAVLAGDTKKANELLRGPMRGRYEEHRAAIDEVVRLTTKANEDLESAAVVTIKRARSTLWSIGAAVALMIAGFAYFMSGFARSISERVALVAKTAGDVAGGDLTVTFRATDDDETGHMLVAVQKMTESLNSLVTGVKRASVELLSTATTISSTSRDQEATVTGFGASSAQIAAAVKEISATSQELQSTVDGVAKVTSSAAGLAERSRADIDEMTSTMKGLSTATTSIGGKLGTIREKANEITAVVTTITKVADQTNLLSVNAAIEAEKAGELGRGFLVLAREIRRLADQTAVATLDIDRMVRGMQAAVTAGVMEMDKFTDEVRRGVGLVGQVGRSLGQVIENVSTLNARFESVNEGMRSQSEGARQINLAMVQLSQGARKTADSIREYGSASDRLRGAVDSLRDEIAPYRVRE